MPAPTNISAATATVISSLPYSITQNVHDAGTTYTVWYVYPAVTGDNVIGVWGFGDLVTYTPTLAVFSPDGTTAYLGGVGGQNKAIQIPVTPGQNYYFRFTTNGGNPTPASLAVSVLRFQDQAVPVGSIAVNDDTDGFPLALLSESADETPLAYVQNVCAGEAGDILPNGLLLLDDTSVAGQLKLYDSNYTEVATVSAVQRDVVTTNKADTFYIGRSGSGLNNATWTTVSNAGVLGPTVWDLGAVGVISGCVSPDETILYYIRTGNNRAVQRWDLVNDAALSDLVTGVNATTATSSKDMLSFSDGSIIVLYRDSTNSISSAKHYSAAGATLHTYTFTYALSSGSDRLCYASDETSFWIWLKGASATSAVPTMLNVRISDGTVLTTRVFTYYSVGVYRRTATATPTARFGMSSSCPFWITRTESTPPPGLNGPAALAYYAANGLTQNYPIVRVRRFPHLSDEGQRIFFQRLEILLQAGVGDATTNPVIELRYSNDGGATFTQWRTMNAGKIGEYKYRCFATQLGMARDRVFEIRMSGAYFTAWLDAILQLEEGLH